MSHRVSSCISMWLSTGAVWSCWFLCQRWVRDCSGKER